MTNHSALETTSQTRTASVLAHLSAPISAVLSVGWLSIVGPLIVWLLYRDRSPFVRTQAAGAFNFQLTMWLAAVVGGLMLVTVILIPLGIVLMIVAVLGSVVLGVIGALKAANGQPYSYPWKLNVLH